MQFQTHEEEKEIRDVVVPTQDLVEIRNGFPYTPFDERREFIGPRNRALRFPTVARFNIAAERQIRLGKWRPWLGVRVLNGRLYAIRGNFHAVGPLDSRSYTSTGRQPPPLSSYAR